MSNLIFNSWYVAGWRHDFDREPRQRMLLGKPVVLYRKADGTLVALEDRCVHRMAPLSLGRVEGDDLRCLYHGFKFAPDGRCNDIPGQETIPPRACVKSYPANWVAQRSAINRHPASSSLSRAINTDRYMTVSLFHVSL